MRSLRTKRYVPTIRSATGTTLFLRAERLADGRRTFQIAEGEPLSTGCGEDLFQWIFGTAEQNAVDQPRAGRA